MENAEITTKTSLGTEEEIDSSVIERSEQEKPKNSKREIKDLFTFLKANTEYLNEEPKGNAQNAFVEIKSGYSYEENQLFYLYRNSGSNQICLSLVNDKTKEASYYYFDNANEVVAIVRTKDDSKQEITNIGKEERAQAADALSHYVESLKKRGEIVDKKDIIHSQMLQGKIVELREAARKMASDRNLPSGSNVQTNSQDYKTLYNAYLYNRHVLIGIGEYTNIEFNDENIFFPKREEKDFYSFHITDNGEYRGVTIYKPSGPSRFESPKQGDVEKIVEAFDALIRYAKKNTN